MSVAREPQSTRAQARGSVPGVPAPSPVPVTARLPRSACATRLKGRPPPPRSWAARLLREHLDSGRGRAHSCLCPGEDTGRLERPWFLELLPSSHFGARHLLFLPFECLAHVGRSGGWSPWGSGG